ncbi:hypothetical protein SAMN02745130_02750 [Thiothrix eikelboomii]|uniref:DNA recombination protein RmuC n=1 Tax=Thiothrix eikelboomii TaxID=92487 RepID=A0A1T4XD42_9GAMM|nr:hypothetical protein [Thiothrix eikelboomii]SKA86891.1 hypothetical protein SAMN02745130_02750 [Thiothrix eikelboomii]
MVNLIDVVIIALSLMAFLGAFILLRPKPHQQDAHDVRKIRLGAELDQQRIAEILNIVQHGAQDANYLNAQLKTRVEEINHEGQTSRRLVEEAERTIQRVKEAESELRSISTQLGERIQYVQTYWDGQLTDTVEAVRNVHTKLTQGLNQVDEGLSRLRDQEKMAQGFTQKLIENQKMQFAAQQENARLATDINAQLESMLRESNKTLHSMQAQQQQANSLFAQFTSEIQDLEQQAQEYFTSTFQTTDVARQELIHGLAETREKMAKLREQDEQGSMMGQRIRQQFEKVDKLQVDRLAKAVDLTDEMCVDLQTGLENARNLLKLLEEKTQQVLNEVETEPADTPPLTDAAKRNDNLFSLSAYR